MLGDITPVFKIQDIPQHSRIITTMTVDCDFKGTGETEEELMNNLVDHAIKDHGYTREDVMKPVCKTKLKPKPKNLS